MTKGRLPGNPMQLLQQIQRLQEEMVKAKEALAQETLTVTAGGGAITVVITGDQRVRSITIDPALLASGDIEMLQDLLVAAINQAIERSQAYAAERLNALAGQMGLSGLL
ncbi:YbaB/EbfC family nucleoid-associated protein [Thermoflexus sp.]|uniref:YbaB/EbfC family nucleoid-associated protein n=1 Tax=Thermoflexus sp. TaxID=1969742 RepID=UPI002ADD9429|nr:YbaB/EbfC family nucleoid-associated protein [Thermoflexus sp.]